MKGSKGTGRAPSQRRQTSPARSATTRSTSSSRDRRSCGSSNRTQTARLYIISPVRKTPNNKPNTTKPSRNIHASPVLGSKNKSSNANSVNPTIERSTIQLEDSKSKPIVNDASNRIEHPTEPVEPENTTDFMRRTDVPEMKRTGRAPSQRCQTPPSRAATPRGHSSSRDRRSSGSSNRSQNARITVAPVRKTPNNKPNTTRPSRKIHVSPAVGSKNKSTNANSIDPSTEQTQTVINFEDWKSKSIVNDASNRIEHPTRRVNPENTIDPMTRTDVAEMKSKFSRNDVLPVFQKDTKNVPKQSVEVGNVIVSQKLEKEGVKLGEQIKDKDGSPQVSTAGTSQGKRFTNRSGKSFDSMEMISISSLSDFEQKLKTSVMAWKRSQPGIEESQGCCNSNQKDSKIDEPRPSTSKQSYSKECVDIRNQDRASLTHLSNSLPSNTNDVCVQPNASRTVRDLDTIVSLSGSQESKHAAKQSPKADQTPSEVSKFVNAVDLCKSTATNQNIIGTSKSKTICAASKSQFGSMADDKKSKQKIPDEKQKLDTCARLSQFQRFVEIVGSNANASQKKDTTENKQDESSQLIYTAPNTTTRNKTLLLKNEVLAETSNKDSKLGEKETSKQDVLLLKKLSDIKIQVESIQRQISKSSERDQSLLKKTSDIKIQDKSVQQIQISQTAERDLSLSKKQPDSKIQDKSLQLQTQVSKFLERDVLLLKKSSDIKIEDETIQGQMQISNNEGVNRVTQDNKVRKEELSTIQKLMEPIQKVEKTHEANKIDRKSSSLPESPKPPSEENKNDKPTTNNDSSKKHTDSSEIKSDTTTNKTSSSENDSDVFVRTG